MANGALLCKRNTIRYLVEPYRVLHLLSIEHGIFFEYTISTAYVDINIGSKFGGGVTAFVTIFGDDGKVANSEDIHIASRGDLMSWLTKLFDSTDTRDEAFLTYFGFHCSTSGHYVNVRNSRQYGAYSQKYESFDDVERCAFDAFCHLSQFLK